MKRIENRVLAGERALFQSRGAMISSCRFENGESPLKESEDLSLKDCTFAWKYPLWYCRNVKAENCVWEEMARAGVWYSENIDVRSAIIHAPKNFRRCKGLSLRDVRFPNAAETLWQCSDVTIENVYAKGDYFAMNCDNLRASDLTIEGNYSFDGARNVEVRNARLLSKDSFWNSENVTVYDSYIVGEYLGWNSKNLTFVRCEIESVQGLCYIENLKMIDCKTAGTTLAFEYSDVDAQIDRVESILNPRSGRIEAKSIGELILEKERIDPERTTIVCDHTGKRLDRPEWIEDRGEK